MGFALLYPSYGGFPGEACRAQVRSYGCARLEFPHGQHPPPRLNPDFAPLRVIGWLWEGAPDDPAWREAMAAHPQARPARVVEQHRSEEHTSELQSLMRISYAVFCLKKKR